MKKLLFSKRSV